MTKTELINQIKDVLQKAFPGSHVVVELAYAGALSVKVVGRKFNGKREQEKQAMVWDRIRKALGDDSQRIRWIVVYGDDEL